MAQKFFLLTTFLVLILQTFAHFILSQKLALGKSYDSEVARISDEHWFLIFSSQNTSWIYSQHRNGYIQEYRKINITGREIETITWNNHIYFWLSGFDGPSQVYEIVPSTDEIVLFQKDLPSGVDVTSLTIDDKVFVGFATLSNSVLIYKLSADQKQFELYQTFYIDGVVDVAMFSTINQSILTASVPSDRIHFFEWNQTQQLFTSINTNQLLDAEPFFIDHVQHFRMFGQNYLVLGGRLSHSYLLGQDVDDQKYSFRDASDTPGFDVEIMEIEDDIYVGWCALDSSESYIEARYSFHGDEARFSYYQTIDVKNVTDMEFWYFNEDYYLSVTSITDKYVYIYKWEHIVSNSVRKIFIGLSRSSLVVTITCTSVALVIAIVAYFYARVYRLATPDSMCVVFVAISFLDVWTDILWMADMLMIRLVYHDWKHSGVLQDWLWTYIRSVVTVFILSGASLESWGLFYSRLFGLKLFSMPLLRKERRRIAVLKVFTVLFENVPQVILQCIYLTSESLNLVTSLAIVASILSIFTTSLNIFFYSQFHPDEGVLLFFQIHNMPKHISITERHIQSMICTICKFEKWRCEMYSCERDSRNIYEVKCCIYLDQSVWDSTNLSSIKFRIVESLNELFQKEYDERIEVALESITEIFTMGIWNSFTDRDMKYSIMLE